MRQVIAASCCTIVGLQILIGVPVVTCLVLFLCFDGRGLGTAFVELDAGRDLQPVALPVADDEGPPSSAKNDSILEARHQRGSLLAGTMLGGDRSAEEEQREFVAAFRQVAAEDVAEFAVIAPANVLPAPACNQLLPTAGSDALPASADRFAVEHLYLIAEQDEQASLFERSDQWRRLARAIRQPQIEASDKSEATLNGCLSGAGLCPVDVRTQ